MSAIRTIENEQLKVCVSDQGAELCSIYDKKAGNLDSGSRLLEPPCAGTVSVCGKGYGGLLYL